MIDLIVVAVLFVILTVYVVKDHINKNKGESYMMAEKYATIEILDDGEEIFDSVPNGRYMVREFDGDIELGAEFYETIQDAEKHVLDYQRQSVCGTGGSD